MTSVQILLPTTITNHITSLEGLTCMLTFGPSPPGAPTFLPSVNTGSIDITITPPTYIGGATITGYNIYSNINNPTLTFLGYTSSIYYNVSSSLLQQGTAYSFSVSAINTKGEGNQSNAITVTPTTVPGAPTITSITPGNTTASLSFSSGSNGGSVITNYQYGISTDGITYAYTKMNTTSSPFLISGLTNGTYYYITLQAINVNGTGSPSSAITVIPSTVPEAPTITSIINNTNSLTVNFNSGSNGGSPITIYQYSIDGQGSWVSTTSNPITMPYTLDAYTTYTIHLQAYNINGWSLSYTASFIMPPTPTIYGINNTVTTVTMPYTDVSSATYTVNAYLNYTYQEVLLNDTKTGTPIITTMSHTPYSSILKGLITNLKFNQTYGVGYFGFPYSITMISTYSSGLTITSAPATYTTMFNNVVSTVNSNYDNIRSWISNSAPSDYRYLTFYPDGQLYIGSSSPPPGVSTIHTYSLIIDNNSNTTGNIYNSNDVTFNDPGLKSGSYILYDDVSVTDTTAGTGGSRPLGVNNPGIRVLQNMYIITATFNGYSSTYYYTPVE